MTKPLYITELVLRDAHQSLLATRMRLEDMLPIAGALDELGYWSIESWGGATFDACIRFLGEDPWERLRALKQAMPKTPQQMLLRGQNLLGYRHYADDVVRRFVERAKENGVDVFRIFDAMNDVRNMKTAIEATLEQGGHAQGTLAYTVSPVHTLESWFEMAEELASWGCHSICIKDMAGLLRPYEAEALVKGLKSRLDIPIAMQCHATTGLSTATYMKAIDAGVDILDTAISPMSMTYGHSATETLAAVVEGTERDTGLDLEKLAQVADYFRDVREKYAAFEGSLKGVDARILLAQVPGGMLTNLESQLKQQGALDKLDEVLAEIPKVREELGFIPLVTPTSQIVGTQAVLNVLSGKRYGTISKETAGVLKGEYGATAAPVDEKLQAQVLAGEAPLTERPANLIEHEVERLTQALQDEAETAQFKLADNLIDDVLTYALFPQVGLKFFKNRGNPEAFEPTPEKTAVTQVNALATASQPSSQPEKFDVLIEGQVIQVEVGPAGSLSVAGEPINQTGNMPTPAVAANTTADLQVISAPLSGNIWKLQVQRGDQIAAGQVVLILEAMKMETEIRSEFAGQINNILIQEGAAVEVGQALIELAVTN